MKPGNNWSLAIIGGGAAGFFSAISAKENFPEARVKIFEKSRKVLAKVAVSGGGRCNVTHDSRSVADLLKAYPRGGSFLRKVFQVFDHKATRDWFERHGVPLVIQDDGCLFPKSQDAQTIIRCFLEACERLQISIHLQSPISRLKAEDPGIRLFTEDHTDMGCFDKVIVTTGGSPKLSGLDWLAKAGHRIEQPVPSLFTFNMPEEPITRLMGIVADPVLISIPGTSLKASGPLLITHWGMSGPAVLILSAFGARLMHEKNYHFAIHLNWLNEPNQQKVSDLILSIRQEHGAKQCQNYRPSGLPARLWTFLLEKYAIPGDTRWDALGKKGMNKLINALCNDAYTVEGQTTFRDEFVTCGGVSLEDVDPVTMESKRMKNLYFAGEVLDIDAITGGFNFQAAWSTAYVAARLNTRES